MKRILVDMSATLIHHGHIRLLQKASSYGYVIVALTTDSEIKLNKGYEPELSYEHREEILRAIRYVDDVVPSPWLIDTHFLVRHDIDLLVHGHDNSNPIPPESCLTFHRTSDISSSILRGRVLKSIANIYLTKH